MQKVFTMKLSHCLCVAALTAGVALSTAVSAHDMVPGKPQTHPILLANADLHTVTDGVLSATDLLFENGKITRIAATLDENPQQLPEGTQIIDARGKHVYPGLIALSTQIGLVEVDAVRATNDTHEVTDTNPDLQAKVAFNTDSEVIPTLRANGISHVQSYPSGSLIMGQSSVMNLDAWNWASSVTQADDALHINWPSAAVSHAWWVTTPPDKQREASKKRREALKQYFVDAYAYYQADQANLNTKIDSRWQSMLAVFSKQRHVMVHANDKRDIQAAVSFFSDYGITPIIVGGADAWMLADWLAEKAVPVVYTSAYGIPARDGESFAQAYQTPKQLADANVSFAIAVDATWQVRDLPFAAGMARNYGLTTEQALEAVTLSAAKMAGMDKDYGSLSVGKSATLFISQGDVLDFSTSHIESMYIDGRFVDLNSRHKQLFDKYKQRYNAE